MAHKLDDRGGVSTLTGSLTIQGTPNLTLAVDVFHTNDTTFGATALSNVVAGWDELRWFGQANLRGNVTIGSGPSQTLTVQSPSTFARSVAFSDDVTANDDVVLNGTLTANGAVTVNATSQIGTDATHTCTIGGPVVAQRDVACQNNLSVSGGLSAGNSSSDTHTFRGACTFNNDVTVATADLSVTGNVTVTGNTLFGSNSGDSCTIPASLTVSGPLTLNGALSNQMTFTGFGRVPARTGVISSSITLNVANGNLFIIPGAFSSPIVVTMSDTGSADDDYMIFLCESATATRTVILPSGTSIGTLSASVAGIFYAMKAGTQWYGLVIASA